MSDQLQRLSCLPSRPDSVLARGRQLVRWILQKTGICFCGNYVTIRIDQGNKWIDVALGSVRKDLATKTDTKSAWAHLSFQTSSHMPPFDQLLRQIPAGYVPSSVVLHALWLLISQCNKSKNIRRSNISMLSFPRRSLRSFVVRKTPGPHIVASLECCHRDISIDGGNIDKVEQAIKDGGPVQIKFTRDQLQPLYEKLRCYGLVQQEVQELADFVFERR